MLFKIKRKVVIAFFVLTILALYSLRNISSVLISVIAVAAALLAFFYFDHAYKFKFPERYYIYIFVVFVLGWYLGGGNPPFGFYYRFTHFDKLLHFFIPLLISIIIFFVLNKKLKVTLRWKMLMTVVLVFGLLGLFEIGEFLSDLLFGTLYQGVYLKNLADVINPPLVLDPHTDTMWDLIMGLLGSLTFISYVFIRSKIIKR